MNRQIHATLGYEDTGRQFRTGTLLALCACALVLAMPKSIADARSSTGHQGVELNGVQLNGFKLNGFKLNGFKLNGIRLNGSAFNSAVADPPSAAELVAGSADLVGITLPNGEKISR